MYVSNLRWTTAVSVALLAISLTSCGGKVVRSAGSFIDDILRGGRVAEYQLGEDASRAAAAALEDGPELEVIRETVENNADAVCFVLDLIDRYSEAVVDSTELVDLQVTDVGLVRLDASNAGIDSQLTDELVDTAQTMAQSTLVSAASNACDIADSGL